MKKLTAPIIIITGLILALIILLFGFLYQRQEVSNLRQQNEDLFKLNQALQEKQEIEQVALFFIKSTFRRIYLKPELTTIKTSSNKPIAVIEALLKGPDPNSKLEPVFPEGTKLLSLEVNNGLATVNLNQRACELNVGSEGELLAVLSIVNTLTKLPEISKVKFLIEGQEVESLAGHVDLTMIFKFNGDVVIYD